MSRDIPGECDTSLDIILLEKFYEFKTFRTLEWDGEPVWGPRVIREGIIRTVLEILHVSLYILTPLFEKSIQLIKLDETEGGVHLTRFEMIPCDTIEELPVIGDTIDGMIETLTGLFDVVTDAPPIPKHQGPLEMCGIIEHHHTTDTPSRDDMTRVEARGTDICAVCSGNGVSRILKESDTRERLANSLPIGDVPDQVGEEETLGLWGDNLLKIFNGGDIRIETNITKHRFESQLHERRYCRCKSTRWCNHFGPLRKVEGAKTEEDRTTSRIHEESMFLSEEVRYPLFKFCSAITKASEPAIAKASFDGLNFFFPI